MGVMDASGEGLGTGMGRGEGEQEQRRPQPQGQSETRETWPRGKHERHSHILASAVTSASIKKSSLVIASLSELISCEGN